MDSPLQKAYNFFDVGKDFNKIKEKYKKILYNNSKDLQNKIVVHYKFFFFFNLIQRKMQKCTWTLFERIQKLKHPKYQKNLYFMKTERTKVSDYFQFTN